MNFKFKVVITKDKIKKIIKNNLLTYLDIYIEVNINIKSNTKNKIKEYPYLPSGKKNWIVIYKIEKNSDSEFLYPKITDEIKKIEIRKEYEKILEIFYFEKINESIKEFNKNSENLEIMVI